MVQQDQAIQTLEQDSQLRGFCSLRLKHIFQFLSSLILPLMLGVFTVVITFQQQKTAREQRLEDLNQSREQRLQDLNQSQHQRNQEKDIAIMQRDIQINAAHKQYQDEVLVAYIKDISDLLEKSNGSLTSNKITATIARAKTLNTIRQLDGSRNSHVIRFLYEAGQLTNANETIVLDISAAVLVNISESVFETVPKIGKLSLVGVYLRNCTLNNTLLHDIDFSSARLNYFNFSVAELDSVAFSLGKLTDVGFASATLKDVNFSSAQLNKVNFSSAQPGYVSYSCARFDDVEKLFTRLINVNFASTTLQYVYFHFGKLQDANFSSARFDNVNFLSTRIDNADFRLTKLNKVDYSFAKINHMNFSSAQLENVNFSFAELWHVQFSSARLVNVNFSSAILRNVDFINATLSGVHFSSTALVSVNFFGATMYFTNFVKARYMLARFDAARLHVCVFLNANVKGTQFYKSEFFQVDFSDANLHKADFTGTKLTKSQLKSALSIRDTVLPDGTLGRDPNLIDNGKADCNSSLLGRWQLKAGNTTVMLQSIKLVDVWNAHLWPYSHAVLNARLGNNASVQLSGISSSGKILNQRNSSSTHSRITMSLHEEMQTLEILVEFHAHFNKTHGNNSWCNDIELFIDYDTESYFLRAPPLRSPSTYIHPNATWIQNGITVAGGNGQGDGMNQLYAPAGLYVDDDETVYVADANNYRIVEWKCGATSGRVVVEGNADDQLINPTDVIVDKERDSLIICDQVNERVVRWPLRNGTSGETIIWNIDCCGLTMDENGDLYVVHKGEDEVRRYRMGESEETVVAGGNGKGSRLNQLDEPHYVFVDRDHSVYVSDWGNVRVTKWEEGAKEGIVVAARQGEGDSLSQMGDPEGVVVDQLGTAYVADWENHRIMRWRKGDTEGSVIAGGNGEGGHSNQLNNPVGLSFDRHGNLYIVDTGNHRVQKFNIEQTTN